MPTAAEIADFLGARLVGAADPGPILDIVDDSRTVCAGDAYLAVPGARSHGLDFQDDVAAAGAALVISDRPARVLPTVVVDDPRRVAGPLADWFHRRPSDDLTVFGVTGTNGKSSTAAMIHAGLLGAGREAGLVSGIEISGPGVAVAPTRTTPEATVVHRTLDLFRRGG